MSDNPKDAFFGSCGWRMGTLYWILCIILMTISIYSNVDINIFGNTIIIQGLFIETLSLINIACLDPFGMHKGISPRRL